MKEYLQSFRARAGHWVLIANVSAKTLGFLSVLIVTRVCSETEFGSYTYAMNLISALVPLMGFGAFQAFLRFSADVGGQLHKKELYKYSFEKAIFITLLLIVFLQLSANWWCVSIPESVTSFRILSFLLLTTLWMEYVKSYARSIHMNIVSARMDLIYALSLLLFSILFTVLFGVQGYALAVVISPIVAIVPYWRLVNLKHIQKRLTNVESRSFWSYGLFTSLGAILNQFFYAADIILIGYFASNASIDVAIYRVSIIIPMASLVLPSAIASADFMQNALRKNDKVALKNYILNYWKVFGLLSLIVLFTISLLAPMVLGLFGGEYVKGVEVMRIYLIGSLGAHLLRVPFGNLLSAVGKASWNTYINAFVLVLTILLCGMLLPLYGIKGAAIALAIMTWMSGLLNAGAFWWYWRGLQGNF
ncbi:MAG: oligosaccharide flippase family protein [Flavobacteriales bacterium]|jgi:O-antigen/teichoic acid export membrane protein